jgi:hypothetical protein
MRFLLLIIFINIYVIINAQNISDTLSLHWNNGNIKYCEWNEVETIKHDKGDSSIIVIVQFNYYDKEGMKISKERFVELYTNLEVDSIVSEVNRLKNIDNSVDDYSEIIRSADNAFYEKKYADAIKLYNSALILKPNEEYPKMQIKALKKIQKKKKE